MAYQGIGTGTLPNDNTGDNLRDAGIKINDNFSEIYNHFGDGSTLTAIVGTGIATESGLVGAGVTLIDFRGSAVDQVTVGSGIATITVNDDSTFSGNYNDLTNKPTIPTNNNQLTNGAGYITAGSTFSGNYNDLSNKPTIPADTGDLTNNVGFITAGDSGAGLTALTGADEGTYGNATNAPQITVDANGRITSISAVAISGGGGGSGISGVNIFDSSNSLGVTTNISFNDNLDVVSIGNTFTVSVSGVVTSLVGYATEGYVDNAIVGLATTGALVGFITSGALVGYATEGYVDNAIVGFITAGGSGAGLTALTGATQGTYGNATNSAQIEVDSNGRITSISAVAISGGGGGGGSGDYSEVAGIATYTSEWTLGADGINHYTFTGPGLTGAENDPALYLTRGQQYKFYNNSGGHPFRIQSTPNGSTGTQYNDGISTNDVGAGSTLTWDVQFDAPNKLYYQCTSHPNMGGPIYIIPRTEPAVGVRTEVSGTTGSVGAGATANLDIDGFKSYGLLKVGISSAAWVRLYVDTASRTSDASRSYLTDPSPGSGLIAEVRTETAGISTFLMTPGVIGWNNEVSIGSSIYAAVTNNESSSATITVDLTVVKMED